MAKLWGNFFALSILLLKYDQISPPAAHFPVLSSISNKQHIENRKDVRVVNMIEATFGTSLSPLFIQHGGMQKVAEVSANNQEFIKIINVQKGTEHTAKGFLTF